MCGYFGTNFNISLDKPEEILKHRGPNSFGKINFKEWNFFHNRLSIVDLNDRANQPYIYQNLICLYNGEIYNFNEIKQKLIKVGYTFDTKSDTEVVVKAFDYWGKLCLSIFNGMFSITIFDKSSGNLTIVRDRFGIKPIYYSLRDKHIFF